MTRFGILGAAALIASAITSSAMAQNVVRGAGDPYRDNGYDAGRTYQNQNWQDQDDRSDRRWRDSYNRYDNDSGYWAGDVAAGVVGDAVGTAAAIAAAPLGAAEYARRNGFVCIPGSIFRGEDGRTHLCQ